MSQVREVVIFDPPMCCAGGLCGPEIDPALMRTNDALMRLQSQYGVTVKRYLMNQHPQAFQKYPQILRLMREEGMEVLPITLVDGQIAVQGRYPGFEELAEAVYEAS